MQQIRQFTVSELTEFNGKNGKPAYVGFKGKVYDVTDSYQWINGEHLEHMSGQDLTEAMDIAPHSDEVMDRMKIVGVLTT